MEKSKPKLRNKKIIKQLVTLKK